MYLSVVQQVSSRASSQEGGALDDVMSRMGVTLHFERDEEIYGQDEEADMIYRVVKGAVRTTQLMSDGRRQVGDFYYPGEIFGIEPGARHLFSAEALADCEILVLRRSAMRDLAGAQLEQLIWAAASSELKRAHDHVVLLGRKTACERVASFLLAFLERSPSEGARLPMGRQDMADYLGLTIETVSRMLSQLQSSAVIELIGLRDFRVANRAALARLAQ